MKFQDVLNKRHSVREYEKKKVPTTVLKQLVNDAIKAPSAANKQPWKFIIVQNKKVMEKIREEYKEFIKIRNFKPSTNKGENVSYNFYSNMGNCQNIIFAYMEKPLSKNWQFHNLLSISAAIENLLLSATNRGLGTCWIGSFKDTSIELKLKKILKLNKNEELVSGVVIGYTKKGYSPWIRDKKKLEEVLKII